MNNTPTPHNEAKKGEIAERIILPGDPLRAKFLAENYLSDVKQFNKLRNMFGYTGKYKGVEISVMGTGMGCPSMGIYSYELIKFYGCKTLIRTGTIGALQPNIKTGDLIIAQAACWTSSMQNVIGLPGVYCPVGDFTLAKETAECADEKGLKYHAGNVLTTDYYYSLGSNSLAGTEWAEYGVLGVEMETAMLYLTAATNGAHALSITTVSNSLVTGEEVDPAIRERGFTNMLEVALDVIIKH